MADPDITTTTQRVVSIPRPGSHVELNTRYPDAGSRPPSGRTGTATRSRDRPTSTTHRTKYWRSYVAMGWRSRVR